MQTYFWHEDGSEKDLGYNSEIEDNGTDRKLRLLVRMRSAYAQ